MSNTDPDGRTVVFATGTAPGFQARVLAEIATQSGVNRRVAQMFESISQSPNVHTVYETMESSSETLAFDEASAGDGTGTNSDIYLSLGTLDEGFTARRPFGATLVHEFSHAEDYDTGTHDETVTCVGCAKANEQKATRMENLVRGSKLSTYNGLKVPNPTSVPSVPKPPKGRKASETKGKSSECAPQADC
jgi:hypothetical protein